jgi:8-oxo-dGTP pyrophosphatase MutT (NUDIX family)
MTTRRSWLDAALAAHVPADDAERAHRDRMRTLVSAPGDPFARDHYAPGHFTASAFVLSPAGDALLLILHAKLGRWLQPGGHVDPADADLLSAARREVTEETGLAALVASGSGICDLDIHLIPARPAEPSHEHFDVRFLFRAREAGATAASDARAVRWVPLTQVAAIESDASVVRAVRKILATAG